MARGRERDLAGGDLLAGADDPHDLRAHALDGDVEALEHARGEALLLAQQPEQDVLGADVVVLERPRLLLRENDDLPGPFCESLEHVRSSFLPGRVPLLVDVVQFAFLDQSTKGHNALFRRSTACRGSLKSAC